MSKRKRNDDNDSSENESKEDLPDPFLEHIPGLSPVISPIQNHNFNPDEPPLLLEHGLTPVAADSTATASGVARLEIPAFPDSDESDKKKVEDAGGDLKPAARDTGDSESAEEGVESDEDKKPAARDDSDRIEAPDPPIDPQGGDTAFDLEDTGASDSLPPTRGVPSVARLPSAETEAAPPNLRALSRRQPTQAELAREKTERARKGVETWYERFRDLVKYKIDFGNCDVPQDFEPNQQLGSVSRLSLMSWHSQSRKTHLLISCFLAVGQQATRIKETSRAKEKVRDA